jgi:hypothetical protein
MTSRARVWPTGDGGKGLLCLVLLLAMPAIALEPREVFKSADPSIVVILTTDRSKKDLRFGSGVLIDQREAVTNCHVLEGAARITVKQGNVQRSAKLRFEDAARDLCQIQLDDGFPDGKPVSGFVMSRQLEVGQSVFAIGAPQGLEHTLSRGIVSALRAAKDSDAYLIQTDAAVSQGSSGGGLFDAEARLIGITTFVLKEGQNLNFAIPADWIPELTARNRDRIAGSSGPGNPSITEPLASDSRWHPRVGDRWIYRLLDGKRPMGNVAIEVVESGGGRVRERIIKDNSPGFLLEREVRPELTTKSFQPLVSLPGGYQLVELTAYLPPGVGLSEGTAFGSIPGEIAIPQAGKRAVLWDTRVIGTERTRVPAGEFETWKVRAVGTVKIHHGDINLVCQLWYSASVQRVIKISLQSIWPIQTQSTHETLELVRFEPASR